jgi:hypothetical protein
MAMAGSMAACAERGMSDVRFLSLRSMWGGGRWNAETHTKSVCRAGTRSPH